MPNQPTATAPSAMGAGAGPPVPPPALRLVRFRVRNFRGLSDATVELGETTVLMGENNVGFQAGDRVVVEGFQKVKPGALVKTVQWAGSAAAAMPAAPAKPETSSQPAK